MLWLIITISAYFIFAIVSLIDKFILKGPIPKPKVYSFWVGVLGILTLFLIPFVGFSIPDPWKIFLSFLYGTSYILALFLYFEGLHLFETSRIVPAIGALTPLFVLVLTFISGEKTFSFQDGIAFSLLIFGSILITLEKGKLITLKSLQLSAVSAFFFSLAFFLSKILYSQQSFWTAFILMRIGVFIAALFFLFSKEVKEELFEKRGILKKETAKIFILGQGLGAVAFLLQNFAIFLVPFSFLAFCNALEGTKYIFLLIFTVSLSLMKPFFAERTGLKEEVSKRVLFQKIIAILLIIFGLAILTIFQ